MRTIGPLWIIDEKDSDQHDRSVIIHWNQMAEEKETFIHKNNAIAESIGRRQPYKDTENHPHRHLTDFAMSLCFAKKYRVRFEH